MAVQICEGIEVKHTSVPKTSKENLRERFFKKVDKSHHSKCWIWIGARLPAGYGIMQSARKACGEIIASRISFFIQKGPIPKGLLVCHKCDNPPCVNPSHLFLGTGLDNAIDSILKGRRTFPKGGRFVDQSTRVKIFEEFSKRTSSRKILAEKYGVSAALIKKICRQERSKLGIKPDWNLNDKFTPEQLYQIYIDSRSMAQDEVAIKYGISSPSVCKIIVAFRKCAGIERNSREDWK